MLDELKEKAADVLNNENVNEAGGKAKEFINSEKGKEVIENMKEKAAGFIKGKLG